MLKLNNLSFMFKPPELYKTEYIIILLPYVFLKLFLIWG